MSFTLAAAETTLMPILKGQLLRKEKNTFFLQGAFGLSANDVWLFIVVLPIELQCKETFEVISWVVFEHFKILF